MLKVTQQPDIISFGGGLPAPELFPLDAIAQCTREVFERYGPQTLQYSVTEGIPELRSWVAGYLTHRLEYRIEPRDVIIVNGSQQGLDLVGKILLDPGDRVVVANPTYLGAIQAFDAYEAAYLTVEADADGILPDALERVLADASEPPKLVYIVPNFQNPTGTTLARERREAIVRICERYGIPLFEDDPYGELRFEGEEQPALSSFGSEGTVIYAGTASKTLAPGVRVAWIVSKDHELLEKMILAKQGADLQPGTLTQYLLLQYATRNGGAEYQAHIGKIRQTYHRRRDVMLGELAQHMPTQVTYSRPEGGMFLWAHVDGVDTTELLKVSAAQKVVFVPGESFYAAHDVHDGMRLNFSNSSEEKIAIGIERLAHAVRTFLDG
ncbi:MAG TPA: PLP-dependent aminotransferase family protein [Candidatus Dormibacteraeota bacterium]|nr:PLP-dependent aminotransferase family protein [Candidatus Dormibacteraeota bacterium]